MQNAIQYQSKIKTVPFGEGKTITIKNNTPILNPKERERRKKEIEQQLYSIFSKYSGGSRTASSQY